MVVAVILFNDMQEDLYDKGKIDISEYDAFELRVRGDGRRFIANVTAPTLGRKDDVWQCFVYTRGGPEWENIRVSLIQQEIKKKAKVYS